MELETKFLRLRTPVRMGSRFDDWQVTLGGRLDQTGNAARPETGSGAALKTMCGGGLFWL